MIFLKCKICFIYVGFNCKRKKWVKKCLEIMSIKNGKIHLKFPFWLLRPLPIFIFWSEWCKKHPLPIFHLLSFSSYRLLKSISSSFWNIAARDPRRHQRFAVRCRKVQSPSGAQAITLWWVYQVKRNKIFKGVIL